jgi:uncharacterized protein Yka (UPF0111/DUF47 family)
MSDLLKLLKKFSDFMNEIDKVLDNIKKVTNPSGTLIYKSRDLWVVVKPEEDIPGGVKREILIVSNPERFVTDMNKFKELAKEFQDIKKQMEEIVNKLEDMGEPGTEIMRKLIDHYRDPIP